MQQQAGVYWMHADPVTKSKRVTNSSGAVVSTVEPDPWGAGTSRTVNMRFNRGSSRVIPATSTVATTR